MPGMMSTILNLGLAGESTAGLAAETGDPRFALDTRLRFLSGFARAVYGLDPDSLPAVTGGGAERHAGTEETRLTDAIGGVEALIRERAGGPVPDDAMRQLELEAMHRVEEHNRDACHVEFKGPSTRSRASRTTTFRPWWWRSRAQMRPASPA